MKKDFLVIITLMFCILSATACSKEDENENNGKIPGGAYVYKDNYKRLDNSLRILTYNVHRCKGLDNKIDYDRLGEAIETLDPDVVALQELDSMSKGYPVYQLEELGKRAKMNYYYGCTVVYSTGKYGIGILSKIKPLSVRKVTLPGTEEVRGLLIAEFDDFVFMATHFSLTAADRAASAQIICNEAKKTAKKIYLAGDLNESNFNSDTFLTLLSKFSILSTNRNTFPANSPKSRIDYILGYTATGHKYDVLGTDVAMLNNVNVTQSSDHLPVIVDLKK